MFGTASLTTIVIVVVSLPPLLVAVIVYTAELVIAVGVPLMSPVDVLRETPAGRDGETDQETTCPVP
tara:strand:- start:315 stop:515 length:201 start_codon:yes stop_codon:yes gene_type:complete